MRHLTTAARCALLLLLVSAARASARPGMGGNYVGGSSRSSSPPSSTRSTDTSSPSSSPGRSGTAAPSARSAPSAALPPTADDDFNAAHPTFRHAAALEEASFRLREDGRVELLERSSGWTPQSGLGLRYEPPVRGPLGWKSSEAGPLSDGLLSGTLRVSAGAATADAPLVATTQHLRSGTRSALLAWVDAGQLPRDAPVARAEVAFVPAREGDELAWTWEVPRTPCARRTAGRLRFAWPTGLPAPRLEVFALDAASMLAARAAAPVAVQELTGGHELELPGCDVTATLLFIRATFPPGALERVPDGPLPPDALSHVVQVHLDGSLTVSSRAELRAAPEGMQLGIGTRGLLADAHLLHPAAQLHAPVAWDIVRAVEDGSPTLRYRAFGHVGPSPVAPGRARVSFGPPWLPSSFRRGSPDRAVLHDVRFLFDDPSWAEGATAAFGRSCSGDQEACAVARALAPSAGPGMDRPAPGELRLRVVQASSHGDRTLELDLAGADPTRWLTAWPLALAAHVSGARGEDELYGARQALAAWLGLVLAPVLGGTVLLLVLGMRRRAREAAARAAGELRTRAEASLQPADPAFRWAEFEARAGRATALLMRAWNDGTLEQARHVLSSGVYQRFRIQCRLLRDLDGVRNFVQDFEIRSAEPAHVGEDGAWQVVHVRLRARLRDVTLPAGTDAASAGKALRAAPHHAFEELHTWVRRLGAATVPGRDPVERRECPGCGAPPASSHASARCGHCGVVFNAGEADWVLSEITQVSEWNGAREATPWALPDGLSRGVLEDKASALFWRALEAGALGDERLRPFTATPAGTPLGPVLGPAAGRHANAVVGAVTLTRVEDDGAGGLRAEFELRWSSRRLAPAPDAAPAHRRSVVTLSLPATDHGAAQRSYADGSDCTGCGAPAPDLYAPACEHCGAALPIRVRDWRLVRIE